VVRAENSLRRLQTDHIDLYQSHSIDPITPLEETLTALDDAVRQGQGPLSPRPGNLA
jgi:aryl-alcohol dehydrogenase-like predicted oxidoreductase